MVAQPGGRRPSEVWDAFKQAAQAYDEEHGLKKEKSIWWNTWRRRDVYIGNGAKPAASRKKAMEEMTPCLDGAKIPPIDPEWAPDPDKIQPKREKGEVARTRQTFERAKEREQAKKRKAEPEAVEAQRMQPDGEEFIDFDAIFKGRSINENLLETLTWAAHHCDPLLPMDEHTAPSPLAIVWAKRVRENPDLRAKFLMDVVQKAALKHTPKESDVRKGASRSIDLTDQIEDAALRATSGDQSPHAMPEKATAEDLEGASVKDAEFDLFDASDEELLG